MREQPRLISASAMLNGDYRKKLRSANRLRPIADRSDIIWQQMTLEHFGMLMSKKCLHCKAYGEYSTYDEVRFRDYQRLLHSYDPNTQKKLIKFYEEMERKVFVSCWYSSPDLSDICFKAYAKEADGIAIGTRVGSLMDQLGNAVLVNNTRNGIQSIYCGNIQYVPRGDMDRGKLFNPEQVYAPFFLKGFQFRMDQEFRVCIELEKAETLRHNSAFCVECRQDNLKRQAEEIITQPISTKCECKDECPDCPKNEQTHISVSVVPASLIWYIAVKDDGVFHYISERYGSGEIAMMFRRNYGIDLELEKEASKNGFLIFSVKTYT